MNISNYKAYCKRCEILEIEPLSEMDYENAIEEQIIDDFIVSIYPKSNGGK